MKFLNSTRILVQDDDGIHIGTITIPRNDFPSRGSIFELNSLNTVIFTITDKGYFWSTERLEEILAKMKELKKELEGGGNV